MQIPRRSGLTFECGTVFQSILSLQQYGFDRTSERMPHHDYRVVSSSPALKHHICDQATNRTYRDKSCRADRLQSPRL